MLLYVSYKKKHLLKPPEYFIVNLAVSDLGLTLSLYPMAISSSLYHRCRRHTVCLFLLLFSFYKGLSFLDGDIVEGIKKMVTPKKGMIQAHIDNKRTNVVWARPQC